MSNPCSGVIFSKQRDPHLGILLKKAPISSDFAAKKQTKKKKKEPKTTGTAGNHLKMKFVPKIVYFIQLVQN